MSTQPMKIYQNAEYAKKCFYKQTVDGVKTPVDLTGAKIVFTVHDNTGTLRMNKELTEASDLSTVGRITDAVNGEYQIMFTQTDTTEVFDGTYVTVLFPVASGTINYPISGNAREIAQFAICSKR